MRGRLVRRGGSVNRGLVRTGGGMVGIGSVGLRGGGRERGASDCDRGQIWAYMECCLRLTSWMIWI